MRRGVPSFRRRNRFPQARRALLRQFGFPDRRTGKRNISPSWRVSSSRGKCRFVSEDASSLRDNEDFSRALVTGATGLIGLAVVKKLVADGVHVNALVRNGARFEELLGSLDRSVVRVIEGDLGNQAPVDKAVEGVEVVFHSAAKVHALPRNRQEETEFYRVNVAGTENLLRSCQKRTLRGSIFFSTIAVYGRETAGPIRETTPCYPEGAYAKSKYEAEERIRRFFEQSDVKATILRLSLVFGEGERGNFLRTVRGIEGGRFVFVGSGECLKSMTYVENVVEAALLACRSPSGYFEVFNVADPSAYPLQLVVETVARHLGVPVPIYHLPASLMRACGSLLETAGRVLRFHSPLTAADVLRLTTDTICDISKIRDTIGFQPQIGLEEGIARTIRWYREEQTMQRED